MKNYLFMKPAKHRLSHEPNNTNLYWLRTQRGSAVRTPRAAEPEGEREAWRERFLGRVAYAWPKPQAPSSEPEPPRGTLLNPPEVRFNSQRYTFEAVERGFAVPLESYLWRSGSRFFNFAHNLLSIH